MTHTLPLPDYHAHESFGIRTKKLREIRNLGIDPYPHRYDRIRSIPALHDTYAENTPGTAEEAEAGKTERVAVAGRITLFRPMGKNAFAQIKGESGLLQVMCNRDKTTVRGLASETLSPLKFIEKKLDLGDIIGARGCLFRTRKGELTLFCEELTLLCKALLPLPDKHSGLADKGIAYGKRWLDLITRQESMDRFKMRSLLLSGIRRYYEKAGFIEVETPILQNIYGGAEARPFTSELHALRQTMYLRIALEISLKKLIVGGFSKVFEIGKVFRNEGIDKTHNPEFTMLESYAAYGDYHDGMTFVENLFAGLAQEIYGSTIIGNRVDRAGKEHLIDLKAPWKRLSMSEAVRTFSPHEPATMSDPEMRTALKGRVEETILREADRGTLLAYLFEEFAEEHLILPHHIIDHPRAVSPLAKGCRDPQLREEGFVERFETFILGYEFCNSYSELNDPELQRELLEKQQRRKEEGDTEASPMDEEFIEAICQGMPPTVGIGIGIDRLTMLFTGATSIRDVITFPIARG
ncbi:MAG: lysine--tRNA ligase [Simkaniaceae bacterium]|nr:lysine--tRNA ligase [Simkaniaceae bacterium]